MMYLPQPVHDCTAVGRKTVVADSAVHVSMPLSFVAFCLRNGELYQRYAAVHVGAGPGARRLVEAVLGDLAMRWWEILSEPSPAAASWRVLAARVSGVSRSSRTYELLDARRADAVVLRYRLGLPVETAADLMGIEEADLARILRAALGAFPK